MVKSLLSIENQQTSLSLFPWDLLIQYPFRRDPVSKIEGEVVLNFQFQILLNTSLSPQTFYDNTDNEVSSHMLFVFKRELFDITSINITSGYISGYITSINVINLFYNTSINITSRYWVPICNFQIRNKVSVLS